MSAPLSARANTAATQAAVNMMPGGAPRYGAKNPLLVRDDVGKAKPSCYDLPHDRFTYGRPGNHDAEGAREVSMFWVGHKKSSPPESSAPDFAWFNKRAASARVTTAKDLKHYRREHDELTPRYGQPSPRNPQKVIPSDVISGFTYGKKVRPSTPMDDVMSYRYAEQAEDDLMKFYTEYRDEHARAASQVRKIPLTNASRGHATQGKKAHQQEETREEHFKIKKFRNVSTKIDNRRQKLPHAVIIDRLNEAERASSAGVGAYASDFEDGAFSGEDILGGIDAS